MNMRSIRNEKKALVILLIISALWYSKPGSNRHGHYWPQDFKSGVSTYSTIRATAYFR